MRTRNFFRLVLILGLTVYAAGQALAQNACGYSLGSGIYNKWIQLGGANGILGCPVMNEAEAGRSRQGTIGRWVQFGRGDGGFIIWHGSGRFAGRSFEVHGCIFKIYKSAGGTTSWLGFPVSDEYDVQGGRRSDFEGGYIVWNARTAQCQAYSYSSSGGQQGETSETLVVPNDKPEKVMSRTALEAGRWYIIEASGTFDDWGNTPNGIDAVWCFAEWRCGKQGEAWDQLRINGKGMTETVGQRIAYNPQHVYQIYYLGQGRPVEFFLSDAIGSPGDNKGSVTVKIIRTDKTGGGTGGSGAGGGGGVCSDSRTLAIMDEWLTRAVPLQNRQPGWSVRYESWGRLVGRSPTATLNSSGPPDTKMSRCEWLWYYSSQLNSTNLGTLREYVERRMRQ